MRKKVLEESLKKSNFVKELKEKDIPPENLVPEKDRWRYFKKFIN